ncbi:pilus assembly protein PilM [Caballeronia sp. LZ062]|uniref:pilus assembly protein PilM n=1 Tax=unclassified Caballeronia TaxID=2646786 RepID=UPI002859E6F6|nr:MULTISPECIES: pilus assembly protein PilM [unclassified Caballeronia]MDR5855602.1 pilus assembly protein PilM [Caballeronia sp. LZ050]MDR5872610.1 pilus assembly protein PilM [Caballeronia sp. LZ062]
MRNENAFRGTMLTVTRRFAAGIDVSEDAVRIAVLSRRLKRDSTVCVEHLDAVPLAPGAVVESEFVDRAAVAAALREAVARLPQNGAWRALRCAMGLPASATHSTRVPLARLIETREPDMAAIGADPCGLLEPAVLAEAERVSGIERSALAVDWSVHARANGQPDVAISATARQHVEARVETAAAAGIALCAIDGEPAAALRAMRHSGKTELGSEARYLACWLDSGGLYGWLVNAAEVEREVRYPAPEYASATDALRDLAGATPPGCIFVGGQEKLLAQAQLSLPALTRVFGCPALPFESAPYCHGASAIPGALKHSPLFAVAFGLALREVLQ